MRTLQLFENSFHSNDIDLAEGGYRNYDDNRTGFSKNSQAYRADGGANDENHEIDRQREQQEKSGTWYIRLNGKLIKDKQGNPYAFRGKAAANKAALTMQAKLFNKDKEFILTTNPNDKPQGVAEGSEDRSRLIHFNTWTVMDSDEVVMKHSVERDPFFSAKKFIRQLDDEGYEFTHVISPEGRITYLPQHDPRHLKNFPDNEVAEGSQQVDSIVTDALKIMQGPKLNDAVQALKTVLGDREYNGRRGFYNFYVRQIIDMYGQQGVNEGAGDSPVAGAITRRVLMQRTDLLSKYGPEKVTAAIDEVADFVGDVDEIGSSDVSGWVKQVEQMLADNPPEAFGEGVAEGAGQGIMVNGKEVDTTSLEVDGVDPRDYPDFSDAYFSAGYFVDGTEMSDQELDQFQNDNGDLLYDRAYDSLHESEISQSRISKMNKPNQEFYGKNPHFAKGAEVKNVGKTVDAGGNPVSALATKVTPQFNKPAPVKKLRATPFEEGAGDLQQRLSTLESAMVKARNITKAIKYDGTVSDILVSIRQLAENAGIDARDLTYAEDEVFDAKKQLESAIYGLDEIFEDAIQNLQYQIQDAEEN